MSEDVLTEQSEKKRQYVYVHLISQTKMYKLHQFLTLFFLKITLINSYNISSCIPNTSCQCYLTQYSFILYNCSHTLFDLPTFNSKTTGDITKIIARNALIQWPFQLCKYPNIQILDLSGSYFDSQFVNFSCLNHLIHLNLSNTQLNKIPNFKKNFSNHLQILDLSNNHIKIIDGTYFQPLNYLISLFLQNNPIEYIEHIENLFNLTKLESINLISSNLDVTPLKQSLTIDQWIDISNRWNYLKKSLIIRMNNIPLQLIIPNPDQFESMPIDSMKIIIKTLINSTFITQSNTPKCICTHVQNYQRMFSSVNYQKKYSSPLFQSTKCLMPDGTTHARLFDRRTSFDLQCRLLGRMSIFPFLRSSSSSQKNLFIPFFHFLFILFVLEK